MITREQEIQMQEMQFPAMASSAFASAREAVLKSGQSVLQSEDGVIFEVFPNGDRVIRKRIEPPSQYKAGQVFNIR